MDLTALIIVALILLVAVSVAKKLGFIAVLFACFIVVLLLFLFPSFWEHSGGFFESLPGFNDLVNYVKSFFGGLA